jgi:IclR family KDG regulon transcriptional repressor
MAKDPKAKVHKNVVPMVMRTFDVLEVFREKPDGVTYKAMAERFPEIPPASIFRILCSLVASGYLYKVSEDNRYLLGSKFIEMGRIAESQQDLVKYCNGYLDQLIRRFDENVNLVRLIGADIVYLATRQASQPLRVAEMRSRHQSVHSSASGKAILAYLNEADRDEILNQLDFVRLTPNTIFRREAFLHELSRIRKMGWAVDAEENVEGISCVAAPLLDMDSLPAAAISITAPTFRMPQPRILEIAEELTRVGQEISTRFLGYHPTRSPNRK